MMLKIFNIGTVTGLMIASVLFLVTSVSARVLYDDFSGTHVDDQKWSATNELVREVANGQLISKVGNHTNWLVARNNTTFQNSSAIHTVRCEIAINEIVLDSGDSPESFARVNGTFYNSRSSGGATGDVWAGVAIGDRGNGLEAWWEVVERSDDTENTWTEIDSGTLLVSALSYDTAYTVMLSYDGANGFTFSVEGVSSTSSIAPVRQRGPVNPFVGLTTGAYGFEGASGKGFVSAAFDNVTINNQTSLYDNFDSPLDDSLWFSYETVQEVANGRLRLNCQGYDQQTQVNVWMVDQDASYVEANVRIDSESVISTGGRGIIRVQGYFYNDSRGPGSGYNYNGYQGDIFADVRLQLHGDGSTEAVAYVGRSNSSDESQWSDLDWHPFSTSISLDTDYRLSIEYSNNQLIFKCNDETYTYAITTPQYQAYGVHRGIRSRVYLDPGEYGYIKTQVDDVYVDEVKATDGTNITSQLWAKAVLEVAGNPVTLQWKMVGADITPSGDQVISGYFYADPADFAYGSQYNPELFVKVYVATNGWCNMAFNHVTVDDVSVYSMSGGQSQSATATLSTRLVEHQYDGVSIDASLQTTGETAAASTGAGYTLVSGLWAKAVLQPATGAVNLIWKEVGTDTTPSGDTVVSGYFYASPEDFAYGSRYNPEVFVKVYIASNGWANMAFNHVTVDGVDISSAHNYAGTADHSGTATLEGRLVEHQYEGVGLQ